MAANIKKLKADVAANLAEVKRSQDVASKAILASKSAETSLAAKDPIFAVELAQSKKDAASPGSKAYVDALKELTQAKKRLTPSVSTTLKSGQQTTSQQTTSSSTTDQLMQQLLAEQNLAAAEVQKAKEQDRQSAIAVLTARFKSYGLESLASTVQRLAVDGATEATITLALQETSEYQQRFKANALRIKSGTTVLTPAEYLNLEDTYRQVLRAYGLTQFDTDSYVSQFIANDMSPTELSNRVVTAVQRVQNADPSLLTQLTEYYGIGSKDLVAYILDPVQQFQKIERQIAAGEIGVAAARQGLTAGVNVAEQLAAQGITQAEAQRGYSTIADILPQASKLSEIYGGQLDKYGQAEAEQEVFSSLASAQRKREKLISTEKGTFSGSSGVNKSSLSSSKQSTY